MVFRIFSQRAAIVLHDLLMVALAWALAFLVRFNFAIPQADAEVMTWTLPVALVVQGLLLWWVGLYRSLWRFASIPDLWNIIRAVTIGTLVIGLGLFLINRLDGVPRSIFALYPLFLILSLGAPRIVYRVWKDHGLSIRRINGRQRVLILGAGRAGEMLARDMSRDTEYEPVGFLDDNRRLHGAKIHGIPVLGCMNKLEELTQQLSIDIVVIAIPSATSAQMRRMVEACEQAGIPFRTLPRLYDLVANKPTLTALREVAIEDLLGRRPVQLDWSTICDGLAGQTVLVSGGGGSIGSELCRQIARLGPRALVLIEQNEYNLYAIELELRRDFSELTLHCFPGDVCDRVFVEHVFRQQRPQVVFHAAAYKHVPLLQSHARQAVRNNIFGTKVLAAAADKFGSEAFVMISTDKAVNPVNVMGATKRVAELICQTLNQRSQTRYITVRFGNVLDSAGSVVPLFRKQIEKGGPVTVTHPEITRYFMTIPEASQLILQSAVMGEGGEIFVLDMGEPVKIDYLAEQMIRLSGKVPGADIEVVYTGLRPGEKLYEELFYQQESLVQTRHNKIFLAQSSTIDWNLLTDTLDELHNGVEAYDEDVILAALRAIVPGIREDRWSIEGNVVELRRANA